MKFTCERSVLMNALGTAGKAVSNRNTLPILSNVLLETDGDRVLLTATDLDTAIRCSIPAQISSEGSIAIPASVLSDIISKFPEAPVTLEVKDNKAEITCGKSKYNVLTLPAEDYPVVPEVTSGPVINLKAGILKEMLRMTTGSASKEETRNILMGVLFEAENDSLTLVATDTHRLALKKTAIEPISEKVSPIIPSRPLVELERMLKDNDGDVEIRFGSGQVQFKNDVISLVSRILDGQFPNYTKVIPKDTTRKITFERADMVDALRRVYIVAKTNAEKSVVSTKGELLEMTAESQDVGKAYEEVPITMKGENIEIAFNTRYLLEALGTIRDDVVSIDLTGALSPGKITSEGNNDFLFVVMPMAI
jgi:DNA polymerase-3 subunit beta